MKKPVIVLAEENGEQRKLLQSFLHHEGFDVIESPDANGIFRALRQKLSPDLLIVSASIEASRDGLETIQLLRQWKTKLPVILLAANSSEELAITALRAGIADYFKSPILYEDLLVSVRRCLSDFSQEFRSKSETIDCVPVHLIGRSPRMQELQAYIGKVATTDTNVLITGETGTGKELVASLIHQYSHRQRSRFVCINCAALPDSLLESELFGYERGAFTGAHAQKEGKLKLADNGTVFFDEIGDMSPFAQAKILRAIESREVDRLGGKDSIPLDIRVIAATNRNLEQSMAEEKFRADLFYRLNVASIHLPPLRERKEDLRALCDHYITSMNTRFGRKVEGLSEEAFSYLHCYNWPGNVRELKNLIEAIFVNLPSRTITYLDLPDQFRRRLQECENTSLGERDRLIAALLSTNWKKGKAAQKLKWSRTTLYRKMVKYDLLRNGRNDAARFECPQG